MDSTMNELVSINDNNRFVSEDGLTDLYLEIRKDENWSSIVKVLDEQVKYDIKLEEGIQNLLNRAYEKNQTSNIRLKDAILKAYPDFSTNPDLKSKF
jgi:hypothetical protein